MLTAQEIREKFLAYFEKNSHKRINSSSLIPHNDPSLLFCNAGMVQFKNVFLGQENIGTKRATTAQKCLRVSGKHNDLENVGRTARHHTFFEMLGNFSFGDYFKKDAMNFAWKFVTEELKLPKDRLYVTVYIDDDEAFNLWKDEIGVDADRIFRIPGKDNFWSMGDTGPCGPCSEIFVDQGEDMACGDNCGIGKCDCDRFLEIWNLVFMQYNQKADGTREPLAHPCIDTGMGLERIAAVCQNKRSNFDCDLFQDIIQFTANDAGVAYSNSLPDTNDVDTALRVIADHSRAAAFLIADGILPSNEGRGYVLRRLIRRALRFGTLIGLNKTAFMYRTVGKVIEIMGKAYPELVKNQDFILKAVHEEEDRFRLTLDKGLLLLEEEIQSLKAQKKNVIAGGVAFKLYDTYGFPLDIVDDIARKHNFSIDVDGYNNEMKQQKERARAAWKGSGEKDLATRFKTVLAENVQSRFIGYETLHAESKVLCILDENAQKTEKLAEGKRGYVITEKTPFYGAGGGQIGDTGCISTGTSRFRVEDTLKIQQTIIHEVVAEQGNIGTGETVVLQVNDKNRQATARNHTCTHLLHSALKAVLGEHVNQAGSMVNADRLRFDFNHISPMKEEEIALVECRVNQMIMGAYPVIAEEMSQKEAQEKGAVALFGEKYGNTVRVLSVGNEKETVSMELCGGTHLSNTGEAGLFLIVSESGVAAGTRRIEAVTGWNAIRQVKALREESKALCHELKTKQGEILPRVDALQKEIKSLRKELDKANASAGGDIMNAVQEINGIKVLSQKVPSMSVKALRDLMDDVRSKLPSGVALLAMEDGGKASLILYVSKDLHTKYTAPGLIKEIAACIDGSGGGRPDVAQAGGTKPQGINDALEKIKTLL